MKVAILGTRGYPFVYSGYETLVSHLAEGLVERGIEVTVYCHAPLFDKQPEQVNGVRLIYRSAIEKKSLSQLSHTLLSMWHACRSNADVIFVVNSANGPFGLISRIFGKPTAINVDGLEWLRPKWKGLGARYFKFASWLSTKWYDQIINDSEEMRKVYLDLFQVESKVIAYGGIKRSSSNPSLIKEWNLESGDYYLIVGRLIPDNNADIIIQGFLASQSTKKLVVVGDVPYADAYSNAIKSINDERLILTGYVKDQEQLAELYHQAYGYFHGHEFGGTNPTMLKAMAYSSAILALDTRFNREMLNEGEFGLFFSKHHSAIRDLVNQVDTDQEGMAQLKANSQNGISQKYTWSYVVDQYEKVFRQLASAS